MEQRKVLRVCRKFQNAHKYLDVDRIIVVSAYTIVSKTHEKNFS